MKIYSFSRSMIMNALWKALFATGLFIVFYIFYSIEIVRTNVEDVAFDTINKFSIHTSPEQIKSKKVLVFAYDDMYMKKNHLFDEDNRSNYGYLFPRDHIAMFIENLDELITDLDEGKAPKALFIDYDMAFSSMPYGTELSKEDKKLIEVLKKPRTYTILLPKTEQSNFIENSKDKELQQRIKDGTIRFVSVSLLRSDDVVRRYKSFQTFGEKHPSREYLSTSIVLWEILKDKPGVNPFMSDDIIGNRIFLKAYDRGNLDEDGCLTQSSQWEQLKKYSAQCSLFDIPYDEYEESVIMLGGTHSQNYDKFSTLSILGSKSYAGIDIHANTLMTMLLLDKPLKRVSVFKSVFIVFIGFFLLDLLLAFIFYKFNFKHEKLSFVLLLVLSAGLFYGISVYFLSTHHLWFNWFVPLVIFQLLEVIFLLRKKSTKSIFKIIKILRR